jgi:hypothetical protein
LAVPSSDQKKTKRPKPRTAAREEKDAAASRPIRPVTVKIPEGGDENLRRRAEWFRKREGQT